MEIVTESQYRFVISQHGRMRVPGVVFATRTLIPDPASDRALEQVVNVAELPGIVEASYAMPDVHWGYGFPIGGVAATDVARGGVVSPGGVGFDITCGVRLLRPAGRTAPALGGSGGWPRDRAGPGARPGAAAGGGGARGLAVGRSRRRMEWRRGRRGGRAADRGRHQVGSLGSGNHFLEVQAVQEVFDPAAAQAFGLAEGQVCVMIHCGSRGLGHQVCTDQVQIMDKAMARYGITVPDRQLACAPVASPEGQAYLGAMAAAANYARANRQLLAEAASSVLLTTAGAPLRLVYDVAHNLAALETHDVGGVRSGCACTGRGRPGRCHPGILTCLQTCVAPGSRS